MMKELKASTQIEIFNRQKKLSIFISNFSSNYTFDSTSIPEKSIFQIDDDIKLLTIYINIFRNEYYKSQINSIIKELKSYKINKTISHLKTIGEISDNLSFEIEYNLAHSPFQYDPSEELTEYFNN